ncbi:MAG: uL14 family ribosomal protein [Pseudomonadota bacterium]
MIIIKESVLKVADNSGGLEARCIAIPGKGAKKTAHVGDIITVSISAAEPYHAKAKVKKGDIFRAVIVATKSPVKDQYGNMTSFSQNLVVLLDRKSTYTTITPIGTRVLKPISIQLKQNFIYNPIISIANQVY